MEYEPVVTDIALGAAFRKLRLLRAAEWGEGEASQEVLAHKAGVGRLSIIRLERGEGVSLRVQMLIAAALRMPMSRVFREAEKAMQMGVKRPVAGDANVMYQS